MNKIKEFFKERKHAHWLPCNVKWKHKSGAVITLEYKCSACNKFFMCGTPYCPYCGARMQRERREDA